jgi:phage tail sheath gpL-like
MAISFNSIPVDIRTFGQYVEIDNSRAVQGTPAMPHKALVMGVRKASGSVAANVPTQIPSGDAAEKYFGVGSMCAEMCRAFKKANPYTELWAIGMAETTTAATFTITPSGTATEAGTIVVYIAGHRIETAVASGDAAATVAANIDTAIQAYSDYLRLPFTSAEAAGIVTLTAVHKGLYGSSLDVRDSLGYKEFVPAGLSVAIAAGTAGVGTEDYAAAITAMGDVWYNTIAIATTDSTSLTALETEMATRFGPMVQQDGHVFTAALGTQGTLSTLGNTRNSPHLTIVSAGGVAGNSPTPLYNVAAIAAAVDAAATEVDPARPRQTLPMTGMLPQQPEDRFTRSERNTLLTDGIATTYVDDGGVVRVERLITTYQTNALSVPDPSYLDLTSLRTLARLRFDVRARFALRYPRHKLADDGTLFDPGQAIITPKTAKAEFVALAKLWAGAGLVENVEQFIEDLIVERDTTDVNRLNARINPDLIGGLRVVAAQIQFLL